jgi:hypothetical protein
MEQSQLVVPLNLPDIELQIKPEYIQELIDLRNKETRQAFIGFTGKDLPPLASEVFDKLGLTPCSWKINMFTSSALEIQKIHLDGDPAYPEKFRPFAINWVWGGRTVMEWFDYEPDNLPAATKWGEFRYVEFNETNCKSLHKLTLKGANLVNISYPHRVINASKQRRFCFSICSSELLSWEEIKALCTVNKLVR